jgi:hypothetical protein
MPRHIPFLSFFRFSQPMSQGWQFFVVPAICELQTPRSGHVNSGFEKMESCPFKVTPENIQKYRKCHSAGPA